MNDYCLDDTLITTFSKEQIPEYIAAIKANGLENMFIVNRPSDICELHCLGRKNITVDGIDYEYDNRLTYHGNKEQITIQDSIEIIAEVVINHDMESIIVEWFDGDKTHTGSFPFFEYEGDDDELVRWVVSTAPWI